MSKNDSESIVEKKRKEFLDNHNETQGTQEELNSSTNQPRTNDEEVKTSEKDAVSQVQEDDSAVESEEYE